MRPLKPCRIPGCPSLTNDGYCTQHSVTREQRNPKDKELRAFYNSTRWKKARAIIRRRDPICKECERRPSQTVDHLGELEDLRPEMLRGMCWGCHNRKSGREHSVKRHS